MWKAEAEIRTVSGASKASFMSYSGWEFWEFLDVPLRVKTLANHENLGVSM